MALGIKQHGDFIPIVKYDSRAGRCYRVDRVQGPTGDWQTQPVELERPAFLADLHHVEVGWIGFPEGRPDLQLVPVGQPLPPRPSAEHKEGFRCVLKLAVAQAGGHPVRHFSHNSTVVCRAFDLLHDAFLAAPESKQGLLPVVQITGVEQVKTRQGSVNFAPTFTIVKWVPRPDDLDPAKLAAAATVSSTASGANDPDPFAGPATPSVRVNGTSPATPGAPAVVTPVAAPAEELAF